MNTYYGLTTQLIWVKIIGDKYVTDNFLLVLDQDNFKRLIDQASSLLTTEQ
jgi:hypothetical protein